jgi:hypothetical protein
MDKALQVVGAVALVVGVGMFSIPLGVIVAGLACMTFGVAMERE